MNQSLTPDLKLKGQSRICFGEALALLPQLLPTNRSVVVVTDQTIEELHPSLLGAYPRCVVGQGESIKTLRTVEELYGRFLELGVDRSWWVVAVGGGIVCDVAGFVASTYMRGLHFGSIPTTLLAQVDASVGGKTGVNLLGYKNMVGTFSQPDFVICDPSLLATLPLRERRAGLAEALKMAVIGDPELFTLIEEHSAALLASDANLLKQVIERSVRLKAAIVERDEREADERRLLNLGHTFGHAIEHGSACYNHGEAIAIGLVMAARVARKQGLLKPEVEESIRQAVEALGLPRACEVSREVLLEAMARDKKGAGERIALILPTAIGRCEIAPMTLSEIGALMD